VALRQDNQLCCLRREIAHRAAWLWQLAQTETFVVPPVQHFAPGINSGLLLAHEFMGLYRKDWDALTRHPASSPKDVIRDLQNRSNAVSMRRHGRAVGAISGDVHCEKETKLDVEEAIALAGPPMHMPQRPLQKGRRGVGGEESVARKARRSFRASGVSLGLAETVSASGHFCGAGKFCVEAIVKIK
jgi:hypothetical protein